MNFRSILVGSKFSMKVSKNVRTSVPRPASYSRIVKAVSASLGSRNPQQFYDGALARIRQFMLGLSGLGVLLCAWFLGWPGALGFVIGASISYINHRWLERMVDAIGERITTGHSQERGGLLVVRAVLRYVSIAVAAYVIFKISKAGLYGFLAGICLPIGAIACEVAVELVKGLRREI
jgi:hypothetical protein